jgi:hypothetical protein
MSCQKNILSILLAYFLLHLFVVDKAGLIGYTFKNQF